AIRRCVAVLGFAPGLLESQQRVTVVLRDCIEREEPHGLSSFAMDDSEQHDEHRQQEQRQHQPPAHPCRLPDDVVEQILCLLPVDQILRSGRTSRAFSRASRAALQGATWAPDPAVAGGSDDGAVRCGTHGHTRCCRSAGDSGTHTDRIVVGTPCLDLRSAADAVDCRALSVMLRRGFGKLEESSTADGGDGAETNHHSGASATRGRKCILRGLAVCSAAVKDQAIARALELHGEGLQILDLAGCRGLDTSLTTEAVRSRCKRLVALDLSGGREIGCAPSAAMLRCAVGGTLFEQEAGLGLSRRHPSCSPSVASLSIPASPARDNVLCCCQANTHHRLYDYHLVSLLTGLGGRLMSLQLRDRPFITDEGIGAIAVACTQLQELDIGRRTGHTGNRIMRTGSITGQALATLSAAPCATLLVCLGLRNRHCVGNMELRALGTHFPSLRRLDMAGLVKVDDDVLRALASTLSLTHIDLSRAHRVSASGVSALAVGSPELACISLHGIAVADGAVRALCDACPMLRHINLSLTRVTERSLRLLAMKDGLRWVNVRCCSGIGNDAVTAKVLANFRSRLSPPKRPRDRGTVLGMERPEPQSRTRAPSSSRRKPLGANSSGSSVDSSGCGGYQGPPDDVGQDSAFHAQAALALRPPLPSGKRLHQLGPGNGGGGGGTRNASSDSENCSGSIVRGDAPIDANGNAGGATKGGRAPPSAEGGCTRRLGTPGAALGNFEEGGEIAPRPSCRGPGGIRASPAKPAPAERLAGDSSQGMTSSPEAPLLLASTSPAPVNLETGERGKGRRAAAIRQEGKGHALTEEASAVQATAVEEEAIPSLAGEPAGASSRDHPPPLLPAGVGDLSLGRHRRRGGSRSSSLREGTKGGEDSARTESQDGGRGVAKGRGGGGERRVDEETVVPFDWATVPRSSGVGVLGSWKGFRGLSGDLVKNIIRELHPHAQVEFRPVSDFLSGPHSRKNTHGYLV
ncbi:unnamed protein product, partial [Ectocarpus sp. 13 AM-2016]